MKANHQHPVYGEILYTENIWTGKKSLTVNGQTQPVPKKEFMIDGKKAIVKGSFFSGATLLIEGEPIVLSAKPKWYESVLAFLPLIFLVTWGNNPTLCSIFPVVGGAIGGGLGGLAMVASLINMKKTKSVMVKLLIGIGIFAVTVLIAFVLALVLILAVTM